YQQISKRIYNVIFTSPEFLFSNDDFRNAISSLDVIAFVIDEAYVIKAWGPKFQQDYSRIGKARALFPNAAMVGVSATMPPAILQDVCATAVNTQLGVHGVTQCDTLSWP
ncbi:hypothetical protein M422DRAFT_193901, partial [Sphaerobolus stellatus SS14]